jgi:hypothetical protein
MLTSRLTRLLTISVLSLGLGLGLSTVAAAVPAPSTTTHLVVITYRGALKVYNDQLAAIDLTFSAAIATAQANFQTTAATNNGHPGADALLVASGVESNAIVAAAQARGQALALLGPTPVKADYPMTVSVSTTATTSTALLSAATDPAATS